MPEHITEPARRIPVVGSYDVIVVGGGVAGAAAAVAAARNGASVCLIEKENALGGLATLGLVVGYVALCDGMGSQIVGGMGEEFLKLSIQDGSAEIPACWLPGGDEAERLKTRYQLVYNAATFILALEDLVIDSGVKLLYDTRFCEVVKKAARIEAVIVENKGGRSALSCRVVIDSSGDADVCARAGEETVSLKTNVAAGWCYLSEGDRVSLHKLTRPFHMHGGEPPGGHRGFAGDDADEVTEITVAMHELIKEHVTEERGASGGGAVYPFLLPTIPTLRMTRRLKGALEIEEADDKRYFEDSIGMIGHWQRKDEFLYIPFRALAAGRTENLLTAGRCIAAGPSGWNVTRVIPGCVVTGEAAGTAAALACRETSGRIRELDVPRLQEQLKTQDVIIDRGLATR